MAINEIKVNTGRLKTDADQVGECIKAMEKQLENLAATIADLNKMWEGPTKMVFTSVVENDRKAALAVVKELKSVHDYEMMAKNRYNECEKKIEDIIASIRV